MAQGLSGTLLLDSRVIDDPHPFYRQLRAEAPVWEIPDTGLFTVSTFGLVADVTARIEGFSSNIDCLLYRDDAGLPCRLPFGDAGVQALAAADPPLRLEPPFRYHMRSVPKDTVLGTVDIPAGATVLLLWGSPTGTTPSSSDPRTSISNGRCRATTWRSGAAPTIASGRPSPASRRATCSPCCSSAPAASPSTPITRRGGSTA
jgi:hypothetical protein